MSSKFARSAPGPAVIHTLDAVEASVVVEGPDGAVLHLNRYAEHQLQTPLIAALGRPLTDFAVLPHSRPNAAAAWRTPDGHEVTLVWRLSELPVEGAAGALRVHTAVAQRPAAPVQRIAAPVDAMPALLWTVDANGTCQLAAGKVLALLPENARLVAGESVFTLERAYPEFTQRVRRALGGEAFSDTIELLGRTFESRYEPLFDERGNVAGAAGVATDVSEQRQTEQAVIQAQKMESLGAMAGGVAHDFNNLLTAILGFAGLVKLSPGLDDTDCEHLYLVEQSARRGADIAGRLLAFARGGLARILPVDVRDVVTETLRLVRPTIHENVRIECELPPEPVMIEGDFGQLQQALLNIVLNARDVLADGGRIGIRLRLRGESAVLEVQDDGPGIPAEVRARIFEPFFTTKGAGSGTGLGLLIAYGIVEGHHGEIEVRSAVGKGTTFQMTFPKLVVQAEPAADLDAGEGDLVLLVDDDDLARRATAAALRSAGYSIIEVATGKLAVDMVTARPGRFAAVLLDLIMPGMAGREVFRLIQEIRPDLPVIVCTGYAPAAYIDDGMKRAIGGLLQKPFTQERLVGALRSVGAEPGGRPRGGGLGALAMAATGG